MVGEHREPAMAALGDVCVYAPGGWRGGRVFWAETPESAPKSNKERKPRSRDVEEHVATAGTRPRISEHLPVEPVKKSFITLGRRRNLSLAQIDVFRF